MPGLEDKLLLVPVAVVDVGTVEALDHFGGAGAGFDGLEDAEGDEDATIFVVKAVRVDDEGDVGEGFGEVEGVHANLPDVVPPADMEGGGGRLPRDAGGGVRELEGDVADAGAPETHSLTLALESGSKLFRHRLLTESTARSYPSQTASL